MADLQNIREEIDKVDNKLLELFEHRMELSHRVAEYKKLKKMPVYDPVREREKIDKLIESIKEPQNAVAVSDLFSQIMAISRRTQHSLLNAYNDLGFTAVDKFEAGDETRIAYYGEKGSYTEQAMLKYFNGQGNGISMGTFEEVMEALETKVDYGVLPIENSSTGTLSDIFDLLAEYDNYIIGEQVITIDHCLWGPPGSDISEIKKIYSHRQGLLQCSNFLKLYPQVELIEGGSTARSARRVLEDKDKTQAAIASQRAGQEYGLKLLQASIHNEDNNQTRFIIISNKKNHIRSARRISICFTLPHRSGALYHILSNFIYNNINLTRIESRPIRDKAFEYRFFADFEGGLEDASVKNALYSISEEALELKILGSYIPVQ